MSIKARWMVWERDFHYREFRLGLGLGEGDCSLGVEVV